MFIFTAISYTIAKLNFHFGSFFEGDGLSNESSPDKLRNEVKQIIHKTYDESKNLLLKLSNKLSKSYSVVVVELFIGLILYAILGMIHSEYYNLALALPILPFIVAVTIFILPFNVILAAVTNMIALKNIKNTQLFQTVSKLIQEESQILSKNTKISFEEIILPPEKVVYKTANILPELLLYGPREEQFSCVFDNIKFKIKLTQNENGFNGRLFVIEYNIDVKYLTDLKITITPEEKVYVYSGVSKLDMLSFIEDIQETLRNFATKISKISTAHLLLIKKASIKTLKIIIEDYHPLDSDKYMDLGITIKEMTEKIIFIEQQLKVLNE